MGDHKAIRASYRCPVKARRGVLTLDGRKFTVELVDESADGLGLLLRGSFEHCVGQTVILRTLADHAEVRVMNAQVVSSDALDGDKFIGAPRTRLGVLRLRDIPIDQPVQGLRACLRAWQSLATRYKPLNNPMLAAVLPATTIVLLVLGLVWALEHDWALVDIIARDIPPLAASEDYQSDTGQWTSL